MLELEIQLTLLLFIIYIAIGISIFVNVFHRLTVVKVYHLFVLLIFFPITFAFLVMACIIYLCKIMIRLSKMLKIHYLFTLLKSFMNKTIYIKE